MILWRTTLFYLAVRSKRDNITKVDFLSRFLFYIAIYIFFAVEWRKRGRVYIYDKRILHAKCGEAWTWLYGLDNMVSDTDIASIDKTAFSYARRVFCLSTHVRPSFADSVDSLPATSNWSRKLGRASHLNNKKYHKSQLQCKPLKQYNKRDF